MFAVIVDGNRQHRVQEGSFLSVDYRKEVEAGASITFDQVLLANGGGASVMETASFVVRGALQLRRKPSFLYKRLGFLFGNFVYRSF